MTVMCQLTANLPRTVGLILSGLLCAACSMNLRPAPLAAAMSLSGVWQVSSAQREATIEQLRHALRQADDKQAHREHKHGGSGGARGNTPDSTAGGKQPSDAGESVRHENWEVREQREQQQALLAAVVPTESFGITQRAGRIDITPSSGAKRSFIPGEPSTLVTTFGSFYIESGWHDNEFVVHSKDAQEGINIIERYHKQMNGALDVAVTVAIKNMAEQQFKLTYRVASQR